MNLPEGYSEFLKPDCDRKKFIQDYLDKNPNGYCHLPMELFELAKQFNR